jgi:hypothetical protein
MCIPSQLFALQTFSLTMLSRFCISEHHQCSAISKYLRRMPIFLEDSIKKMVAQYCYRMCVLHGSEYRQAVLVVLGTNAAATKSVFGQQ